MKVKLKIQMEKTKENLEKYRDNLAIFSSIGKVERFIEEEYGTKEMYCRHYTLNDMDTERIDDEIERINSAIATLDHILNLHKNGNG